MIALIVPFLLTILFGYCCCGCLFPKIKNCGKWLLVFGIAIIAVSQITFWTHGTTKPDIADIIHYAHSTGSLPTGGGRAARTGGGTAQNASAFAHESL